MYIPYFKVRRTSGYIYNKAARWAIGSSGVVFVDFRGLRFRCGLRGFRAKLAWSPVLQTTCDRARKHDAWMRDDAWTRTNGRIARDRNIIPAVKKRHTRQAPQKEDTPSATKKRTRHATMKQDTRERHIRETQGENNNKQGDGGRHTVRNKETYKETHINTGRRKRDTERQRERERETRTHKERYREAQK